jgi:hypothetical protein
VEVVRRLATWLRRSVMKERVIFQYNGHGEPRPTANKEIWLFNRCPMVSMVISVLYCFMSYTQYIKVLIFGKNVLTFQKTVNI